MTTAASNRAALAAHQLVGGLTVGDLVERAQAAEALALRRAKQVDAVPVAQVRKRAKRLTRAVDALRAAIFYRTLALDHASEYEQADADNRPVVHIDHSRVPVASLEEPSVVIARWEEARYRLDAAARQGLLERPGRMREAIEWASSDRPVKGDAA